MKSQSLPKSSLLRKPEGYLHVYETGKRLYGDNFSLIFTPNNLSENRLGISIHGQLKGAVIRNRIKRIIKEFYRLNRVFLQEGNTGESIADGMDIVFAVRKNFNLTSPQKVEQAVGQLLKKTRKKRC